jgi:hypothetical protein
MQEGRLHVVRINTLTDLARGANDLDAEPWDAVLVLPRHGTLILGSADELIDASLAFEGGVCVAASPVPLSSKGIAAKASDAVARGTGWSPVTRASGWRPARAYPYPYAILGPAGAVLDLAASLVGSAGWAGQAEKNDADLITTALLGGSDPLVLDTASQVFHVLDGTGTDAVAVAGRAYSGGEQPLVVLDPHPGFPALARLQTDLADDGSRDLARLLRYEGAIDSRGEMTVVAPDIVVTGFWTTGFCASIIRAAESAGAWISPPEGPGLRSEISVEALSPQLIARMEEDLETRILPPALAGWPGVTAAGLQYAVVVRNEAGEAATGLDSSAEVGQISGAVRLNDGYDGGGLLFPRQQWDNQEAPIGSLALWPSVLPYRPKSVKQGVDYQMILRWHPRERRPLTPSGSPFQQGPTWAQTARPAEDSDEEDPPAS